MVNFAAITKVLPMRGAVAAALLLAVACTPIKRSNGYMPDPELVDQLRPGVHDMDSVATLLGNPTSAANFSDDTWFYVAIRTEQLAFFEQKLVRQDVLALQFDENGVLKNIERFDLDDARKVELSERVTPTRGKELTVMEQLFGNIGRFSGEQAGN